MNEVRVAESGTLWTRANCCCSFVDQIQNQATRRLREQFAEPAAPVRQKLHAAAARLEEESVD